MRALDLAPLAFAVGLIFPVAHAAETPHEIKGLYLMTDYPAVTIRPGTTSNIPLRLQNYGLGPERYQLSVAGVPDGWTATLLGGYFQFFCLDPIKDINCLLNGHLRYQEMVQKLSD